MTSAWFNGAPLVVLGGRAPDYLWGKGALQEMDHVPLLAPVTKRAWTEHDVAGVAASVDEAFRLALTPHRGPVFCDFPLEAIYGEADGRPPRRAGCSRRPRPDADDVARIAALLGAARRPVLVLGSDVWLGGAETAARACAETLRLPVIANGQARGVLPGGHSLLVTRARSLAFAEADLVIVVGVPLDFRLTYGSFGPEGRARRASSTWPTPRRGSRRTARWRPRRPATCPCSSPHSRRVRRAPGGRHGVAGPAAGTAARRVGRGRRPAAGERRRPDPPDARLRRAAARRSTTTRWSSATAATSSRSPAAWSSPPGPGRWLDPGPYGCLGTGLGYAIGRPARAPVVPGRPAARRRRGGPVADGRGHPRPAQPARW